MAHFYVSQERAFAPGIGGEWPKIIDKPGNPNGRLVKLEGFQEEVGGLISRLKDLSENNKENTLLCDGLLGVAGDLDKLMK